MQKMETVETSPLSTDSRRDAAIQALVEAEDKKDAKHIWDYDTEVKDLMEMLDCQYFVGEHEKAMKTFQVMEGIVNEDKRWTTARELLDRVMSVNAEIAIKFPQETTPNNLIYKMRKIIIEEFLTVCKGSFPTPGPMSAREYLRFRFKVFPLYKEGQYNEAVNMDIPSVPDCLDPVDVGSKVREGVIAALMEYKMELDNMPDLIAKQGPKLIFEGDYVMTYGFCPSVAQLFRTAAQYCSYTLYVVESTPLCYGHLLLDALVDSGINVILIPDCNVATLLPKMSKVVMPCAAVLANGDLKTLAMGGVIATVAAMYKKQVYAVAATYQFTLTTVQNTNVGLSPYSLTATPQLDVEYCSQKFDIASCEDIFRVVTNSVNLAPVQAGRHLLDIYTPRNEKL